METAQPIIDKNSPIPLYFQLKQLLLAEIEDNALHPGEAISSENELIEKFQLSRTTVRQAIAELVKENKLVTVKGKGTFVAKPKIDLKYMNQIESFDDQVRSSGLTPSTSVVLLRTIEADECVAKHLQIPKGERVLDIFRVRYADQEPVVMVHSYHPCSLCGFLAEHDLERTSLYKTLALSENAKVVRVKRAIEARVAGEEESNYLSIKKGFPVQHFVTVAYNRFDQPVEYCISKYRGDRNTFTVEIFV